MRRFVSLAILSLLSVEADFFNEYFNDKTFGVNPGPCPFDDGSCLLNLEDDQLNPIIAQTELCLIDTEIMVFPFVWVPVRICDTIGNWVDGGTVEIYEVACEDINVDEISLSAPRGTASDSVVTTSMNVENVFQHCSGGCRLTHVVLTSGGLAIVVSLETTFTARPDDGLDVAFDIVLSVENAGNGAGFDDHLVNHAEVEDCTLNLDLGLRLSDSNFEELTAIFFYNGNSNGGINVAALLPDDIVANLLVLLIESLFGSVVCGVIEQAGTLADGQNGILNVVLDEVNERYSEVVDEGKNNPTNPDQTERDVINSPAAFGTTSTELGDSLNLRDSNTVEFISVTINDFLGNQAISPLPINQAINLLTDPDGTVVFDVRNQNLDISFPLSFANATVSILELSLVDFNTVTDFNFMQNDFTDGGSGLLYTLKHHFAMDNIDLKAKIKLKLERGSWVTQSSCGSLQNGFSQTCTSDITEFTFDLAINVQGIDFGAATLTAFNFDEIEDIQVGQIFDRDLEDLQAAGTAILDCVAPSIYVLLLSDLTASISVLGDAEVDNFSGDGLDAVLENGAQLISILLTNLLKNDLPFILSGTVRNVINDVLRANVSDVTDLAACPPYVQIPSEDPFLIFNAAPVDAIWPLINDVLGNFGAGSDVDLNDFIQQVLRYYSVNADEFPLKEGATEGDWDTKDNLIPLVNLVPFTGAFAGSNNAFIKAESISIRNLNTVTAFNADERAAFPYGFFFDVQFGESGDNLEFIFEWSINSDGVNLDEFLFTAGFEGMHLGVVLDEFLLNVDSLNRLTIGQLSHIPCLQCLIDGIKANIKQSDVSAQNINFDITYTRQSSSSLNAALDDLKQEFTNSNERFTNTVNYFLGIGFEQGLKLAEDADYSLTPEECSDVETPGSGIFDIFLGFGLPNFTFFQEECLADIPAIPDLSTYEKERLGYVNNEDELEGEYFKFKGNFFAELLEDSFNIDGTNQDDSTLNNLLISLANSSGNPISDIFVFGETNTTVDLEIILNEKNGFLDLLGIDPLSISNEEGFVAEIRRFKLKDINNFLQEMQLFQIESNFTTKHHLGFSDATPLTVEIDAYLQGNATIIDGDQATSDTIDELITFTMDLRGVDIDLELFLAIRTDLLKALSVAHFLTVDEDQNFSATPFAGNCWFGTYHPNGFHLRSFSINVAEITDPLLVTTEKLISSGVTGVSNEVIKMFLNFYSAAIPNICENCIREFINDEFRTRIEEGLEAGACPTDPGFVELSEENELFRFSDSPAYKSFQEILIQNFYSEDYSLWNTMVDGFIAEPWFDTDPFSTGKLELFYKGDSYGELELVLDRIKISNLNTFTHMQLFEPTYRENTENFNEEVDPYRVVFAFDYFGPTAYDTRFSMIGYDFFVQADVVTNDIEMNFKLSNVHFYYEMLLFLNLNTMMKIQFDQVDTLSELPCLLMPIQEIDIEDFNFTTSTINASISCWGTCDSPLLDDLEGSIDSENSDELADVLNGAVYFAVSYLASTPAERLLNVFLETSEDTCAALVDGINEFLQEGPPDLDIFNILLYIFIGAFFVAVAAVAYQYPRHKKRKFQMLLELEANEEKKFALDAELKLFDNELNALAASPVIPLPMKIFIPCACLLNIVGLCFAIMRNGMLTILLTITFLGMDMNTIRLVPFTIVSTVNNMWASGAWPLAILIAAASCAWPIAKNFMLLFIYFTPTTIISEQNRARFLELLDIAGKWSFLDVFVVVVTLAALQTYVTLSQQEELSFLDESVVEINLGVQPENGIVILSSIAATSLIMNHIMSYYNHKTLEHYRHEYDMIAGNTQVPAKAVAKKPIFNYRFANRKADPKKFRALLILNIISGLFSFVGMLAPVVTFNMHGLIGIVLAQLDAKQTTRTFSIVSLGTVISEAPAETAYQNFIIILFQFMYFLVSVIGPLVQVVMLTILLTQKFSLPNLTIAMEVGMVVSFWAALDVVLFGICATLLEISEVTKFVVDFVTNDICSNVQGALEIFIESGDDANCLDVTGSFEWGALPLAVGILGQIFCLTCTMILTFRVVQDRYFFAYIHSGLRPRDPKPQKMGYLRDFVYRNFTTPAPQRFGSRAGSRGSGSRRGDDDVMMNFNELATANPRFSKGATPPLERQSSQNNNPWQRVDDSVQDEQSQAQVRDSEGDELFAQMGAAPRSSRANSKNSKGSKRATFTERPQSKGLTAPRNNKWSISELPKEGTTVAPTAKTSDVDDLTV